MVASTELPVVANTEAVLQSPPLRVEIRILDDGRVVFGDLTPELAEVAAVLAGRPSAGEPAPTDDSDGAEATR